MKTSDKGGSASKPKVYFIRLNEESYRKVAVLADQEDRSINSMANYLVKQKLADIESAKK